MSNALQKLNIDDKTMPTFEPLLSDIWGSLYKMRPELKEDTELPDELKTNHSFMQRIMADEKFDNYREYTKLDELSSVLATTKFGEKTKEWLEEQRQANEELNDQLNELQALQRQLEKQEKENGTSQVNEQLKKDLQQARENFNDQVNQQVQQNGENLSQKFFQAFQDTKETKNSVKQLVSGSTAGSGDMELRKVPLKDQLQLAEKITKQTHMKEIAEWAGRLKQIAKLKQKSVHRNNVERSGVSLGNDIEKLMPAELALYSHKSTRIDFLRRFTEGQTLEFETRAKESLGKGPIILCLDQSGSMQRMDTQSKGFAIALMSIAKKQKRDFCYIPFSSEYKVYRFLKGKISVQEMMKLSEEFLDGGTNFLMPLQECLSIIEESRFKKADIVFVTDGEARLQHSFINDFQNKKIEKEFSVLSLLIGGGNTNTLEKFSDRVITINDLDEEGSYKAFEI
ncbi:VWA domain-containing protein [Oceanobacillus sojae]|uniref:VWA domain-containing protein n=1 Tax=Oceanobacillus sojae TaxID=582851 RepID=UPI0036D3E64F